MFEKLMPGYIKRTISVEVDSGGRFTEFFFPQGSLSKYKIIQFHKVSENGETYYGLGVDTDKKYASLKSFYEFLERRVFFEKGISQGFETTNGIAIHKFHLLAKKAALSELLERDSILLHWYSQTPFLPVSTNKYHFLSEQIQELKRIGYKTLFYETTLGLQKTFISFLVDVNTSGFVIGSSSGKSIAKDIEKSFIEACTNLFLVGEKDDGLVGKKVKNRGVKSLPDHRAYWLFLAKLPIWIESAEVKAVEKNSGKFNPNFFNLSNHPFPTVGVTEENILQLRIGAPTMQDIEILNRRLNLKGKKIDIDNEDLYHPIP